LRLCARVCTCVRVYVRVCVHACVRLFVRACVSARVHAPACMRVSALVPVHHMNTKQVRRKDKQTNRA